MKVGLLALLVAYVLPSYSIVKYVAKARDDHELTQVKVEGSATVGAALAAETSAALNVPAGQGELPLTMSVSMRLPGRCRIDLTSIESTRSISAVWANGKKRTEGAELPALQVAVEELCAVLALHGGGEGESRAALERHLAAIKVDTRKTSLGRFGGTVAWVIGETAPGAPQLWVYKEHFAPARVRLTDAAGAAWDVRLLDYTSQATGDFFPRVVEVYKGEVLQLRLTTLSSDARARLDDTRF